MNTEILVSICGLLAITGAIVYSVGDVFLLAGKIKIEDYPRLQAHVKTLSGIERMAALPWWRLVWGGLLGVFATPLVIAGFAQIFVGLVPAGLAAALPAVLLFACASVVGAFVHGSFIFVGEYVQALNRVDDGAQTVIMEMFMRYRRMLIVSYGFVMGSIVVASLWFSAVVAFGQTAFPQWMAAVNPITTFAVWMAVKKVLPKVVVENTEGAGFNIAFLLFFGFTTLTLLNQF